MAQTPAPEVDPDSVPDDRESVILRAVVEEYINTARPVGSGSIAKRPGVAVSPATVRNTLATLENDGYLVQPHTSAGRIPTDKGYRFFVDSIARPGRLGRAAAVRVDDFFSTTHNEIEQMLADTSRLLSSITNHAAVVVSDPVDDLEVCSVQVVGVSAETALVVFVLSDTSVEKVVIERDDTMTQGVLEMSATHLRVGLDRRTLSDIENIDPSGSADVDALVAKTAEACEQIAAGRDEELFVGGTAVMAEDFETITTVREVLSILEQQLVVVTLIRDVLDRGSQVAIGTETGLNTLTECALVVAPYEVDGEKTGSIGVLGPTRMDYSQALAAVAVVSDNLSDRLGSG